MMDLNCLWWPLGAAALFLALVNLCRAVLKKHQDWQMLLTVSLSCGVLAVMFALRMVDGWLQKGDWSAIEDVVPALSALCSIAVCFGLLLNFFAFFIHQRAENVKNGEKTDGES